MFKKIHEELIAIRKELQEIKRLLELKDKSRYTRLGN